jgi:pyruvyl transferase EpsI
MVKKILSFVKDYKKGDQIKRFLLKKRVKTVCLLKICKIFCVKNFVLLGTPLHSNIGDRAITLAEKNFLYEHFHLRPIITLPFNVSPHSLPIYNNSIIIMYGGGNFGDLYLREEEYRRKIFKEYKNIPTILFPQTIFFKDKKHLEESIKIYSENGLKLFAREKNSYENMKFNFLSNEVYATPDIVMNLNYSKYNRNKSGVLEVMRTDGEKNIDANTLSDINFFLETKFNTINKTDMHSKLPWREYWVTKDSKLVNDKIQEFKDAKLVVTDRLHGMIFSLITGTPCICFDNLTHKTAGVYEWVIEGGFDNYIKLVSNYEEFKEAYNNLNLDESYIYHPEKYNKYWDLLKKAIVS